MKKRHKIIGDEMQEEMIGLLLAMSIVSKRLATRLQMLEGGNPDPAKKNKEVADDIGKGG